MPDPLPIHSINHIARTTSNLEASTAFYRDVLGFRPIRRPSFRFPGAWLYNYGIQIHLIARDGNQPSGEIQTRTDHLALHVEDVAEVERLLREHGIAYRSNYVADTNVTQLFFLDPDGNHIEVATYPPTPPFVEEGSGL